MSKFYTENYCGETDFIQKITLTPNLTNFLLHRFYTKMKINCINNINNN